MRIYSIFVMITSQAYLRISCQIALKDTQRFLRQIAFPQWYQATCWVIHWIRPEQFHTTRQFNSFIQFLIYLPIYLSQFSWQEFAEYWIQEDSLDKGTRTDDEQYFFNALDYQDYFSDAVEEEVESSQPMPYSLLLALTTSDDKYSGNSLVATFDGDSSFWVCDNSATGHICNDTSMYHSPLVPSIYWIGTAHRVTVKIW